jgi:glycolate oxidase FAD binding subunit
VTSASEPASLAEARDAMLGAGTLLFVGAGTKAHWSPAPEPVDTVVATTKLSGIRAHDPGDATCSVGAGTPLAELQAEVAGHQQWLAIDPPHVAEGATVGGILCANDAGPRRLRYGTMRDLVIGATVVLADGSVARSGGNVIKNVAGYDLGKLWCGSLGTLGLVAEVVLRLHPLPTTTATVALPCAAGLATRLTLALMAAAVEPVALDWTDAQATVNADPALDAPDGALWVRFAGRRAAVQAQRTAVAELAAAEGATSTLREGEAEATVWDRLVGALGGADGQTVVRGGTLPSDLGTAAAALTAAADGSDTAATLSSHTALGLHTARLTGGTAADHARIVRAWRAALRAHGGHATVRRRLPGVTDHLEPSGPEEGPAPGRGHRRTRPRAPLRRGPHVGRPRRGRPVR